MQCFTLGSTPLPSTSSRQNVGGVAAECTSQHHIESLLVENKKIVDNLQPPTSPRLLQPGFSPPSSPLLACRMASGRGDLQPGQPGQLVASPPSVPHSVHPHSSHLVPPIHQYG